MSHRLFNSLVVSSTLLLEGGLVGCASTATETATTDNATVEASAGSEASTEPVADADSIAPDPTAPDPTAADPNAEATGEITMASCEPGWHSTKAGPSCEVDTSGVTVCCPSYVMVTDQNRASVCCEQP